MDFNKFFQSKTFQVATWAVVGLIAFLLVFKLGVSVGYKKADFSYRWGENYHQNFGGPRAGFFRDFLSDKKDFIESHGVFGQIIKIDPSTSSGQATLVVRGQDDVEKIVLVKEDTTVSRLREKAQLSDLKVDDYIIIIGQPNDAGQIEAKLIRIVPAEPPVPMNTSSKPFRRRFLFW